MIAQNLEGSKTSMDALPVFFIVCAVGMHNIISTLSVSADIGFKIKYRISASMLISTDIITDTITGRCFP